MTNPRQRSDPKVDQLLPHSPLTAILPRGWHEVNIAGVDRLIVVGPGGLFVVVTRAASAVRPDVARRAPWNGVERRRGPSAAQVTADLVSQLLSTLCDRDLMCTPIVLLDDCDDLFFTRVDEVPVLHRSRLTMWLHERPVVYSRATIELVQQAARAPRTADAI